MGIYLHGAKFELCKVTLVLSIVRSTFIYVGRSHYNCKYSVCQRNYYNNSNNVGGTGNRRSSRRKYKMIF